MNTKKLTLISAGILSALFTVASQAQTVVIDDNLLGIGTDQVAANAALGADYFATSSSGSAIEFSDAGVGVVTGFSGRQIHALFPTQTLNAVGDSLTASVTFVTPNSVNLDGENTPPTPSGGNDLRVGLFDNNGRTGDGVDPVTQLENLGQNISASSSTPNPTLSDLAGSFVEMDVELAGSESGADLQIRRHNLASASGRLLGTTSGFDAINENAATTGSGSNSGPDLGYLFLPNNSYTVNYTVERVEALDASGEIVVGGDNTILITTEFVDASAGTSIGTLVRTDITPDSFSFGMIAVGASTEAFGINNAPGDADNGIELTAVSVVTDIADDGGIPVDGGAGDDFCFPIVGANGTSVVCL